MNSDTSFVMINDDSRTLSDSPTSDQMANVEYNRLHFSLHSNQELSLENALIRVQELMKENKDLKHMVRENNANMKEQYTVLNDWKNHLQLERETVRERCQEAKLVVTQLRTENQDLHNTVKHLQMELKKQGTDQNTPTDNFVQAQIDSPLSAEEILVSLQSEGEVSLQEKLRDMTLKLEEQNVQVLQLSEEVKTYRRSIEELEQSVNDETAQRQQLEVELHSARDFIEKIELEKRDLIILNSKLSKNSPSSSEDRNSDVSDTVFPQVSSGTGAPIQVTSNVSENTPSMKTEKIAARSLVEFEAAESAELFQEADVDFLVRLQDEKRRASDLLVQTTSQNSVIQKLEKQVSEKDEQLQKLSAKLEQSVEKKRRLVDQIQALTADLKQAPDTTPQASEEEYKAKFVSILTELKNYQENLEKVKQQLVDLRFTNQELEKACQLKQQELEKERRHGNTVQASLRLANQNLETNLSSERQEHQIQKSHLQELHKNFDQLCNDYYELSTAYETLQHKQNPTLEADAAKASLLNIELKKARVQMDNLTAQVVTAEETLTMKQEEITRLKQEVNMLRMETETIPVLRAQAEIYMADFVAERRAREEMAAQKEELISEINNLQERNREMIAELEGHSFQQIEEMQRRHGRQEQLPRQPIQHEFGDEKGEKHHNYHRLESSNDFTNVRGPPDQEELCRTLQCPKCGISCPDTDTVAIHVLDCLDRV